MINYFSGLLSTVPCRFSPELSEYIPVQCLTFEQMFQHFAKTSYGILKMDFRSLGEVWEYDELLIRWKGERCQILNSSLLSKTENARF
jgi:hypothetical protein